MPRDDEWTWGRDDYGFDIEEDGNGQPGIGLFGNALQVWCFCQDHEASVAEAAAAFRVSPRAIVEAVNRHSWMFVAGPDDDFTKMIIEHEGE